MKFHNIRQEKCEVQSNLPKVGKTSRRPTSESVTVGVRLYPCGTQTLVPIN